MPASERPDTPARATNPDSDANTHAVTHAYADAHAFAFAEPDATGRPLTIPIGQSNTTAGRDAVP